MEATGQSPYRRHIIHDTEDWCMNNLTVGVVSLGCAKNLVDSEVMLGILQESGMAFTHDPADADILVVNTCGFIESAKQESIDTILDLARYKEEGRCKALIVAGCLAQRYREELAKEMPEIDAMIGTGDFPRLPEILREALTGKHLVAVGRPEYLYNEQTPRIISTPKHVAYLKIAEGCDNYCSYCIIPALRGRYRSRTLESVINEARKLAAAGTKELILVAQDTTRYGVDLYGRPDLPRLLKELHGLEGLSWIRLLYCYPDTFSDELIETMAALPKVVKYVDLPLQHASDRLLRDMNRRSTQAEARALIGRLRQAMPDVTIRTTFIVGFPGETEEDFAELLTFMRDIRFDRAGVFTYSQEEGTVAAKRPDQIPEALKKKRYHRAMALQQTISQEKNQAWVGRTLRVLTEGHTDQGYTSGRSFRDAPGIDGLVYFPGKVPVGEFVTVRIEKGMEYDLVGVKVDESGQ